MIVTFFWGGLMKKRFICDLDGTILNGDFSLVYDYFSNILPEEKANYFRDNCDMLLDLYENKFPKYDEYYLSKFLSDKIGCLITDKMIHTWNGLLEECDDYIEDGIIEVLEYLKEKDKSIVVLTNWFKSSQEARLKRQLLLPYFDQVYAGDTYLKPSKDSYLLAKGDYKIEDCVMIGDNFEKDFYGAKRIGMDAVYYNRENDSKEGIKKLIKIKEMY